MKFVKSFSIIYVCTGNSFICYMYHAGYHTLSGGAPQEAGYLIVCLPRRPGFIMHPANISFYSVSALAKPTVSRYICGEILVCFLKKRLK